MAGEPFYLVSVNIGYNNCLAFIGHPAGYAFSYRDACTPLDLRIEAPGRLDSQALLVVVDEVLCGHSVDNADRDAGLRVWNLEASHVRET